MQLKVIKIDIGFLIIFIGSRTDNIHLPGDTQVFNGFCYQRRGINIVYLNGSYGRRIPGMYFQDHFVQICCHDITGIILAVPENDVHSRLKCRSGKYPDGYLVGISNSSDDFGIQIQLKTKIRVIFHIRGCPGRKGIGKRFDPSDILVLDRNFRRIRIVEFIGFRNEIIGISFHVKSQRTGFIDINNP